MEKQLMNLGCIVLRSNLCFLLLVFLFSHVSFGQAFSFDTIAFYKHLKDENLLGEQVVFAQKLRSTLSTTQEQRDSLALDIATAYLRMKMLDSCLSNLKRISFSIQFPEIKKELFFSSMILTKEYGLAENNIGILESQQFIADAHASLSILKREKLGADSSDKIYSFSVSDLKERYVRAPNPSPFLAGVFSTALPGAGKWYVGYKRQALTAFIASALFAAQAAESYAKAGVTSPQFIITAGLFGVFYSGNIWGSVLAAKKKKRDHLNEIDHEIQDHYYTEFSKLYR